ncbi:MAG: hypothetical protein IKP30_03680 [Bacteroidaceae bacterium]|nr:hypothetical protein [Bacteroidaceae bacterium]
MKKTYLKPETTVVALNVRGNLLADSIVLDTTNTITDDNEVGAREVIQAPNAWDEW